jgi:hypothetical protein
VRRGIRLASGLPLLLLLAAAAGCGGRQAPTADRPARPAPDLTGHAVMVLPVQGTAPAGLDGEIGFWLEEQAPRVRWILPPVLEQTVQRTPGLDVHVRSLAVSAFRRAEVKRIGDPLFGDLRRLGAVVGARYAVVPVYAVAPLDMEAGRIEIAVALIDTVGGDVLWFAVVGGDASPAGDPVAVASAARALARAVAPR